MKATALQLKQKKNSKAASPDRLTISLKLYGENVILLDLDRARCVGCDICTSVCPTEAISVALVHGRLVADIDEDKCVLCELCTAFCPTSALSITESGKPKTVLKDCGAVADPAPKVAIDLDKCPEGCDLCVEPCPRDALSVVGGKIVIDVDACMRCTYCVDACPHGAATVGPLFEGRLRIEAAKCPDDCTLCIEPCPTNALSRDGLAAVVVDDAHCVLCGACTNACPHDATDLRRTRMYSGPGYSAVWRDGLEKLTGTKAVSGRLDTAANRRAVDALARMKQLEPMAGE